MKSLKQTVYEMLVENTGRALMDSGDAYGRYWEQNQGKTLADFEAELSVTFDQPTENQDYLDGLKTSVFHVLTKYAGIEIDALADEYNSTFVPTKDWDSDLYGVSKDGAAWIDAHFTVGKDFNTYNGESNLSQTVQGIFLTHKETGDGYVLLQVHGGCDVRGGYTNARLFKRTGEWMNDADGELFNLEPAIVGNIDGKSITWYGDELIDNETNETWAGEFTPQSKIELSLE